MAKATSTVRRGQWNTFAVTGYTHQVGDDARATGGVHVHQVKRLKSTWAVRTMDSNGRYASTGPVRAVSDTEGEVKFEQARSR